MSFLISGYNRIPITQMSFFSTVSRACATCSRPVQQIQLPRSHSTSPETTRSMCVWLNPYTGLLISRVLSQVWVSFMSVFFVEKWAVDRYESQNNEDNYRAVSARAIKTPSIDRAGAWTPVTREEKEWSPATLRSVRHQLFIFLSVLSTNKLCHLIAL